MAGFMTMMEGKWGWWIKLHHYISWVELLCKEAIKYTPMNIVMSITELMFVFWLIIITIKN